MVRFVMEFILREIRTTAFELRVGCPEPPMR